MKRKIIVFSRKDQAELREEEFDDHLIGDQILVKTIYSPISVGTECANYHGLQNTAGGRGEFPLYPGYSGSAVVVKVGPEVQKLKVDDRVILNWNGDASYCVKSERDTTRIEDDNVDMLEASFTHISCFPMLAIRKLRLELGESILIAGQGILGIFATQFAHLSGAYPVIVADYSPERRKLALALGADYALNPSDVDYVEKVREIVGVKREDVRSANGGKGVDAVVEVTGVAAALKQVLECVRKQGRIALLGCTRIPDVPIDFYQKVHVPGIRLIGCHTSNRPSVESRPGQWTEHDDYVTFLKFLSRGRVKVTPIISKICSPADAQEVYKMLVETKNPPLGIVFDWRKLS